MAQKRMMIILLSFLVSVVFGCGALHHPKMSFDQTSVQPGTEITFKGNAFKLIGSPISAGKPLPSLVLVDAMTMKDVDLSKEKGSVLFLSIVASVDTPVCEEQTHSLGEKGNMLPKNVKRIVISRDLPFAQKRFAKEAKLTELQYLSDYKTGEFGRSTGLLVDGLMLLARSVIIVDKQGFVRYIQVVPELTHLPDMDKAFTVATELSKEG